jgi:CelD/BcsL family acetyltransferase involved in cellulose biosynthesis
MRLTWTRGLPEQPGLPEQWNALVLQMETPEVFYTWEWAAAVVRAFGNTLEPWIATAYEGDELVGVAALAKASETEVVFLAGVTADYCDFVSRPAQRKEFVTEVLRALREAGTRTIVLANLPADSATVAELKVGPLFKSFLRTGYVCAQVRLGSGEERRALIDSLLKKKMFRRSINTLQRIGPVTLQHDLGAGLGRGVVEKFCETHVARFLSTGRISNLVSAQRREFLGELARLLADRGWFDLMTLRAGRWVLALNYGFRFQGSWFWYQPTIVNKFEDLSPGYCLLAKIAEDAGRDPEAHLVDLGLGAEGYKERFANAQRITLHITLSRSGMHLWRVRGHYYAAEAIKKRSGLESIVRRVQTVALGGQKRVEQNGWGKMLAWAGRRLQRCVVSADRVLLFQWRPSANDPAERAGLMPITWEILSAGAMRYSQDRETLDYLLRSAARFRLGGNRGYVLMGEDGIAQHFAWAAPYEGFAMAELNEVLHAPSATSVMIFDCWTPLELRGRGLYVQMIGRLARLLSAEGKDVWIFSAAPNFASVAGIEKAGFQMRALLFKRKLLWWSKTRQVSREAPDREQSDRFSNEPVR